MRVLIIDDHATNRELCRIMLSHITPHVDLFADGQGVVAAMKKMDPLPDIILLDVIMPVKDGFTTAKEIRTAFPDQHIPILFLTALDDQDSFSRCLALGDDFIPKPIEKSVLLAKIQAHYRIVKMHQQLILQRDQLQIFQDQVQHDYSVAESIFSNLVEEMSAQIEPIYGIHYISTPSTIFNGNLILVARRRYGGIYVMIADSSVDGLPAAIANIPATRAFFALAERGCALSEMVVELNQELATFLPPSIHVAAHLLEIHSNGFEISWWGGGMPDGYILSPNRQLVKRLASTHQPLGVLPSEMFRCDIKHFKLSPGQSIVCCTKGVIETRHQNGEVFGRKRLETLLTQASTQSFISLIDSAVHAFSPAGQDEDLSILAMSFPIINAQNTQPTLGSSPSLIPCKSELYFSASVLKQIIVMNEVRLFLKGIIQVGDHLDFICSILSELFTKIIEQGLLGLSTALKSHPDGFVLYHQQREQLLEELADDYWIRFQVDYQPQQQRVLFILEHNGRPLTDVNTEQTELTHDDQDLLFATELCESIRYINHGQQIQAVYRFDTRYAFPDVSVVIEDYEH